MGYLERLIERATDTNLDLENNTIGKFRITPQHGKNLTLFFIYKKRDYRGFEDHVCSVIIDSKVIVEVAKDCLTSNQISEISNVIHNLYSNMDITIKELE